MQHPSLMPAGYEEEKRVPTVYPDFSAPLLAVFSGAAVI